jgi:acyl-CoA hydrolase
MFRPVSPAEAVSVIKSGDRVYIHSVAAAPQILIQAMTERAPELKNVEVVHLHTEGNAPYAAPGMEDSFSVNVLFTGANVREAVQNGRANYVPVFLSEVPALFRKQILPLDVALVQVSVPDKHGYCSLGISVDATLAAVQSAKVTIAQMNPQMPRTHGDSMIHISKFHAFIEADEPLCIHEEHPPTDDELAIGRHVAELIEDGATLQMGIGAIPNAVLASLTNHKELGIHTEMFSDGVIPLVEKGIITGEHKKIYKNKIVSGFVMGTRRLYDFIDDNPKVAMLDIAYVNDTANIRKNPKVTAINSAIEVDLSGQVCADTIGTRQFSGVGGQMDFIRGASLSEGGKPIIALPSATKRGESRITTFLKQGAGVTTTRAHVHYIVTEYGVAYLYGRNMAQRAKALIAIAHPDHRERLEREAHEARWLRF